MPNKEKQPREEDGKQIPEELDRKKEKNKKGALSLTEKNRKKIKLWFFMIYFFLAAALAFSTFIAVYKHQKAMASLNKANQIMMTNTGIVIDSVNIKSFQEAEYIMSEKQKTIEFPDKIRNFFMFDIWTSVKYIDKDVKSGMITEQQATSTLINTTASGTPVTDN